MKIYFAGSIKGGRDDRELYAEIINHLKKYGEVLTEHLGIDKIKDTSDNPPTPKEIHDRDMEWLKESDVIVAEVSMPSLGVGYEIGRAGHLGKKIYCFYREGSEKKLSAMIEGSEFCNSYRYMNKKEMFDTLDKIFNQDA